MGSIFFSSHSQWEVIKFFSVTHSAYQSPYSTPRARSYKHSAIPELLLNTKCQDVLVRYTQEYNGQGSDAPELMLNINIECSRAYAQHFQLYFHVFQSFMLNTNVSTHVLQSVSLNTKHLINHVLQGRCATQNISLIMCFRVHAQHNQHIYTYISSTIGLCPIYKTNHHGQQAHAYKWQVQNSGYYIHNSGFRESTEVWDLITC